MSQPARQDLAHVEERPVAAPVSMMDVIAQAVRDPNLDVDKLERLTGLYERLTDRQSEVAFDEAMNAAQADLGPVAADANNPQTKSKYASYAKLDRAIRPIYAKHGFSLSFGTADCPTPEHVRVICKVSHRAGHTRVEHVDMPADGKGAKGGDVMTKTHAVGAAMSYGQRYLLKLIFNIAVGEDADGNRPPEPRSLAAIDAAKAAIDACADTASLKAWKAKNEALLQQLPSDDADAIVRAFNARARQLKQGASQ